MKKILIVDDDINITRLIKIRLESVGYEVITASDGLEGLTLAKQEKPDLVILDVLMPKVNGSQFLNALRKIEAGSSKTPVIVMSGKPNMKDFFDPWDIVEFLPKPMDSKELTDKIAAMLAEKIEPSPSKSEPVASSGTQKKAILAVAQDYLYTQAKEFLEQKQFEVKRAMTTEDAVGLLAKENPDYIFCEFGGSENVVDAEECLKQARKSVREKVGAFYLLCPSAMAIDAFQKFKKSQILNYSDAKQLITKLREAIS